MKALKATALTIQPKNIPTAIQNASLNRGIAQIAHSKRECSFAL